MDKFVCENCFDDYAVVEFIRLEVVEDKCDYCDTDSSSEAIAAHIREVARFIRDGIETEWADPADEAVPWDSEEDSYIVTTYDSYDLLEKVLSIDSDDLRWDIVHYLGDGDWCQKHSYKLTQQEEWYVDWEDFSDQLKHHTRYVFYRVEKAEPGDDTYERARIPHEILDTIGELVLAQELIRTVSSGTEIVRTRPHKENERYSTVKELGPPPNDKTISTRMSPAGIPMFYGSQREDTALSEISGNEFATVAKFKALKDIKVLDLTKIPGVPSLFDQQNNSERAALIFLWNFLEDFTKTIEKDDRVHIEYVPTQVVTEYFRRVFRDSEDAELKGVVYPSARHEGGISYVFFVDNDECTQDNEGDAAGEPLFSMITSSVKQVDLRNRSTLPPVGELF